MPVAPRVRCTRATRSTEASGRCRDPVAEPGTTTGPRRRTGPRSGRSPPALSPSPWTGPDPSTPDMSPAPDPPARTPPERSTRSVPPAASTGPTRTAATEPVRQFRPSRSSRSVTSSDGQEAGAPLARPSAIVPACDTPSPHGTIHRTRVAASIPRQPSRSMHGPAGSATRRHEMWRAPPANT